MAAMNEAIRLYQQGMGRISTKPGIIINQNHNNNESMKHGSNPYQQYRQNTVNTSTPQELTLMLYNGLLKFLKLAQQGIEEKNIEKANNNIIKSQDIIIEFMSTLDMQYEISNGLYMLYDYMNRRLLEANIKKDKLIVEEVIGYAEELRDTWAQAMKLAKQQMVK
jgi:flagellar protein FliS